MQERIETYFKHFAFDWKEFDFNPRRIRDFMVFWKKRSGKKYLLGLPFPAVFHPFDTILGIFSVKRDVKNDPEVIKKCWNVLKHSSNTFLSTEKRLTLIQDVFVILWFFEKKGVEKKTFPA